MADSFTKIVLDNEKDLFIYEYQLRFYLNRPCEERNEKSFRKFCESWIMYNAIEDICENDQTAAQLHWDKDQGKTYHSFPDRGLVKTALTAKGYEFK